MRTEILVNNQQLELREDLAMAFTYSISDIRQPEKRQTDFSKTIRIPGTKLNNQIFSHIYKIDKVLNTTNYNLNFTPDFNPNLKASAKVYIDGINVFDGVIQLLDIIILDNTNISYEVCVFGKLSNIYYNLGENYLHNLDLSEYDHDYTRVNQQNSWSTSIIKNGSAYVNFSGGNPTGEGYVYPLADYGYNTGLSYKVVELFPAVYAKTYLDKIFEFAGFTYTSNFLTSNFFKRLIIPFNKSKTTASQAQINSRKFYVTNPAAYVAITAASDAFNEQVIRIPFSNEYISPAFDTNNLFNPWGNTNAYHANVAGYYNLKWSIRNWISITSSQAINYGTGNIQLRVRIWKEDVNGASTLLDGSYNEIIDVSTFTYSFTFLEDALPDYTGTLNNIYLLSTDKVYFEFRFNRQCAFYKELPGQDLLLETTVRGFNPSYSSSTDTTDYFYNEPINTSIPEGSSFILNTAIPVNVKQKDFFTSLIKMFNLYVDVDPLNEFNLLIEPRNDFYNSEVVDWTGKLDTGNDISIKPMGDLDAKRYSFTYKEDSDHYNKVYKDAHNRIYGDAIFEINNDFLKDENKNEVIFSPTPAVGSRMHNRVVPTFLKYDQNNINSSMTDISQKEGQDTNIRILYYAGLKTCQRWFHISEITTNNDFTVYPYANHLNDPTASTLDLNFGVPLQIFFQTSFYTSNTLYNVYWSDLMGSITDPDSKIVTAYLNLKPTDILQLSFKKLYLIDGNYYRLNKIFDYDPLSVKVTKVEFLKVRKAVAFNGQGNTIIPIVTTYNVIEGGQNEVRDIGATSFYNVVEGSENEVRNIAATSFYNLSNGGLNTI